jgi:hypothetical protein
MTALHEWAARWNVSPAALSDLRACLGAGDAPVLREGLSEAAIQSQVRLEASRKGIRLWRNNVGAMYDDAGNFVRFGLANESAQINRVVKSGDLIGIRPVIITQAHVGTMLGQFVSREVKAGTWCYSGTDREKAQLAWAQLIASLGGDAGFCNGEGTL